MPCFTREKSLPRCLQKDKQTDRDVLAPKPVHPRSLRYHGLFGVSFVTQHMIIDNRWTTNSLSDQFEGMTELLTRRVTFKRHEVKANRHRFIRESRKLKLQCRDGQAKLQKIVSGDNTHTIRNFLINHKDMQRLYQRMPIHLVSDNINQRTFVLRKERDRLQCRLGQLKDRYREMLLDRSVLENRIKYQNEFVLEEEIRSRGFMKKIENSLVRLKAIKTINNTYKKMIQVLRQDEIFYEPILRSLDDDMEDQVNFIKHILYLGMPALAKFKEINAHYRQLEAKSRKNLLDKHKILSSFQTVKPSGSVMARGKTVEGIALSADPKRYLRETKSMLVLSSVQKTLEKTINEVKCGSLCSQAREIYPRIKAQRQNNARFQRLSEQHTMNYSTLEDKMKYSTTLESVLINNLSEEEINRLERITDLKHQINHADQFEDETLEYMRYRGHAFVLLRLSLWNLVEILRHIDREPKMFRANYPNSYLKLPLLKFEMLDMYAVAPELYEEDTEKIMSILKRKVYKLMKVFHARTNPDIVNSREMYHHEYLNTIKYNSHNTDDDGEVALVGEDLLHEQKTLAHIPNRKQIKSQSTRIVDEALKREEEQ